MMTDSKSNREIERKFLIKNKTLEQVVSSLQKDFRFEYVVADTGVDYFFKPKEVDIDFIRIRSNEIFTELTIKNTDKEGITDRMEINTRIENSEFSNILSTFEYMYGKPIKIIEKYFYTLFLNKTDNITVYEVEDGGVIKLFLEVEAPTKNKVTRIINSMSDFEGELQDKSLFELIE